MAILSLLSQNTSSYSVKVKAQGRESGKEKKHRLALLRKERTLIPMTHDTGLRKVPTDEGKYRAKLLYKINETCLGVKPCQYSEKYESEHEQMVGRRGRGRGWFI